MNIELDGIIPARAGFTPHSPAPPGSPPDHPRSRGVYTMRKTIEDAKKGSSPLARGLLSSRHRRGLRNWIIPARAGFTTHPERPARPRRDHPRSRGVYASDNLAKASENGSSPLARGLRGDELVGGVGRRIIPARAGFTRRGAGDCARHRDHPRSRGVYESRRIASEHAQGSSPLARGLRWGVRKSSSLSGIIPARAGFTRRPRGRCGRRRDHPRSRGVYG